MHDELTAFLAALATRRFAWGVADCLIAPADWCRAASGIDPAAGIRGSYDDQASCEAVLRQHGGLVRCVAAAMRRGGFAVAFDPAPGDVGIVRYLGMAYGAICTPGRRWAIKCGDGVFACRTAITGVAWRVARV